MADKASPPHLFADVLARVHLACAALSVSGGLPAGIDLSRVVVEPPREAAHGDMATNAAMVLARGAKTKPRDLAEQIATKLRADDLIAAVEVAGPAFLTIHLKPAARGAGPSHRTRRQAACDARRRMAPDRAGEGDRDDAGGDQGRSRRAQYPT